MSADFWFLDREHNQKGPVPKNEFINLVRDGKVRRESQIWTEGMEAWRRADQVEDFSSLFPPPLLVSPVPKPKAMNFNILYFRSVMFWCAIIGLLGNQLVFGIQIVQEVNAHNFLVAECNDAVKRQDRDNRSITDEEKRNTIVALGCLFSGKDNMTEWPIDYYNAFVNPTFTFSFINEWSLLNHILAWGGLALSFIWIVLKLSVRQRNINAA